MGAGARLHERRELNLTTQERKYTATEVAQFLGVTQQAVRQRILEGKLTASKIRVKGMAREYRISAEANGEHYELTDAEMNRFSQEAVRYRVGFMGWGLGLPFPDYQNEHPTHEGAVAEAKRVLGVLPGFREQNSEMESWLPVSFPAGPDKAIVYPDPFDCARFGMDFELSTVEIIGGVEPA